MNKAGVDACIATNCDHSKIVKNILSKVVNGPITSIPITVPDPYELWLNQLLRKELNYEL